MAVRGAVAVAGVVALAWSLWLLAASSVRAESTGRFAQEAAVSGDPVTNLDAARASAAASRSGPPATAGAAAARVALGVNLPGIADWMYTPVYVDLVHQARRYGSAAAPWDEAAVLGEDGWPLGDFGVVLSTGLAGYAGSAGTYRLSFTGRARVEVVASSARVENLRWDASTDTTRAELLVAPEATQLVLAFRDTGAGIRNLSVLRPGYDEQTPPLFTREFLRHLEPFGTLRFMDWLRTNGTPVTSWASRPDPASTHHASAAGVPWEHVIALANQTGKDLWVNVPVGADDDYVLRLAQLLNSTLNQRAVLYVEYSNEVWNPTFPQLATNRQLAQAEVAADPRSPLARDGATDPDLIALRRVGERAARISDIFRGVFGEAAMMTRVRPVLAAQVAQPFLSQSILAHVAAAHGPPSRYFWALAGAPYFNLGPLQSAEGLEVEAVLAAMDASVAALPRTNHFEVNLAQARWYGLHWLAYEGGADTFGPGSLAAKKAASLDRRMTAICEAYLRSWFGAGGELLMWFTAGAGNWDTPYGTWELTTDLAMEDTPKRRCLERLLAAGTVPVKARNLAPGTVDALAYAGNFPPYSPESRRTLRYLHPGSHVDYLIFAPRGGTYELTLRAAAAVPGNSVDVLVGGERLAADLPLAHAGWDRPVDNAPVALPLAAGFNTLRILTRREAPVGGGFSLRSLTVRPTGH